MKFGLKGTAVGFAALGMTMFFSVPNASAFIPPDHPVVVARTAEVISDVVDATGARVLTVRMSDGEEFVIRDFSAGTGTVRRATYRDFDLDGDKEVRLALRDGRVVEVELDDDVDFDDEDADEFALLVEDGDVIWNDEIALRVKTIEVDDDIDVDDVNAYRDDDGDVKIKVDDDDDIKVKIDDDDDDDVKIKVDTDDDPDTSDLDDDVEDAIDEIGDKTEDVVDEAADKAEDVKDASVDVADEVVDKTEDVVDEAADKVEDVVDAITDDDDPPNY